MTENLGKIISGLACCSMPFAPGETQEMYCADCPYREEDRKAYDCRRKLMRDALQVLYRQYSLPKFKNAAEWYEYYINKPIEIRTKEEAFELLKRAGYFDENGDIKPEFQEVTLHGQNH